MLTKSYCSHGDKDEFNYSINYLTNSSYKELSNTSFTILIILIPQPETPSTGFKSILVLIVFPSPTVGLLGSCRAARKCCEGKNTDCEVSAATKTNSIILDLNTEACYCDHGCMEMGGGSHSDFTISSNLPEHSDSQEISV